MRLQIADIIYHQEQGTLTLATAEVVVLEPKANALLNYLCDHAHQDLSRDQLMEDVWRGQIVSDNAINRVIVQLRKALGDEQTPRKFIATVPKLGYRFIADVRELEDEQPETIAANAVNTGQRNGLMLLFGLLSMLVLFFLIRANTPDVSNGANQKLAPLSRLSSWQFEADLSDDQQQLVYSMSIDDGVVLHLTDLESQSASTVSDTSGYAYAGHWSHAGDKLVYQFIKDDQCEFHQVTMLDGQPQPPVVLQTCVADSYTTFAFSPDDQILYFVERQGLYLPYEIFALDIEQQNKWRLSQPLPSSLGAHYLDVDSESGHILLLVESTPGESSLFTLDAAANSFEKLHDFDYRVSSAIWGHDKNTVVHQGKHPSYELVETNWLSKQSTVLVSDSRRITLPKRINNQKDYLFSSYLNNLDIVIDGESTGSFNSAVMDYLPSLSRDGQRLAFISKRSGYSKVWIKVLDSDELISIEPDDTGRTFYSLEWSYDNRYILANTNSGVIIFDVETKAIVNTLTLQEEAHAVLWSAAGRLSYSLHQDGRWNIYQSDMSGANLEKVDSEFAFMKADGKRTIYLDQELNVVLESGESLGETNGLECARPLIRHQLTVMLDGDRVFCLDASERSNLLQWQADEGFTQLSGALEGAHYYSMKNSRLAKTFQQNATSDIMRTDF